MSKCLYCHAEISEGSKYCPACGKKQVKIYTHTFRNCHKEEEDFIKEINEWFKSNTKVANVKAKMHIEEAWGFFVNKYVLERVYIEYELFDEDNVNRYAILPVNHFDLYKENTKRMLVRWENENPGAIVIDTVGGTHQRGQANSILFDGFGAHNHAQIYVFFKFNRKYGLKQLPPSKQKQS